MRRRLSVMEVVIVVVGVMVMVIVVIVGTNACFVSSRDLPGFACERDCTERGQIQLMPAPHSVAAAFSAQRHNLWMREQS